MILLDTELKQAFSEHIAELRKTLIFSLVTVLVFFVGIFLGLNDAIFDFLMKDIHAMGLEVIYTTVGEVWVTQMKVAFVASFIISFPFISFYFWRFLAPALYPHERKIFGRCFFVALFLFLLGVLFAYFVVLPFTLRFFIAFGEGTAEAMLTLNKFISFLIGFVVPFGLIFLMPMVVYLLTKLGILNVSILMKTRKYVIVLLLIVAAILTPPDIVSQLMLFFPMMILWEVSIIIAKKTKPMREKAEKI